MKPKTKETLLALLGTSLFLIFLVPFFMIWLPYQILLSSENAYLVDIGKIRYLGFIPITLGIVIYFWCASSFVFVGKGTPVPFTPTKKLIVKGFYRFVRNPMYIAGVSILAGEALLFQSFGILVYCLFMFGILNVHVFMEETFLTSKFGLEYENYRKQVPRWIPSLTPYRDNHSE